MTGPVFAYHCAGGHTVESPYPLKACPAMSHGRACCGVLQRFGPGSRKANATAKTDAHNEATAR